MSLRHFVPFLAAFLGYDACAGDFLYSSGFQQRLRVNGYYVGYERNLYPISEVDFSAVTHLMVGRVTPTASGGVTTNFDIDNTNGPIFATQSSDAAHAAGAKAVLMVGGAGEINGWRGAATPANRATFVSNLLSTMDTLHFDGLDLDWEPLETGDYPNFLALAQALRSARPNMILTVPVGWINSNFSATADPFYGTISSVFDQINVMTYDMAGDYPGWQSWHASALAGETGNTPSSIATSIDYYRRAGVPAAKLGIGAGFYGNCWRNVTQPHQTGGTLQASDGAMSYKNIMTSYYSAANRQWDTIAKVPYLSSAAPMGAQACNFVSYDDAESIAAKGAFTRANNLGGIIIWTISQGHLTAPPVGQRDPLLAALRAAFLQ
ncbi:MAG: glycoside hydrolase family 18 protein [Tahibacter sp.]